MLWYNNVVLHTHILTDDGVVEGLIDDAPIEEEEEASEADEDSDADIGKRKKRSDDDDQLEEDDFDLIEENLGIKVCPHDIISGKLCIKIFLYFEARMGFGHSLQN